MHYRARYYPPELGRFISEDPPGATGGDTNLYTYAGGDPINVTDPSGMCLEPATEPLTQTFALVDYLLAVSRAERDGALTRQESAAESDWVIRQNNANMDWFLAMCGAEATFAGLGAITGGLGARLPSLGPHRSRSAMPDTPGAGGRPTFAVDSRGTATELRPGSVVEVERLAPRPMKPTEAVEAWDEMLGPGPSTNIHPRTGAAHPNRLVSVDAPVASGTVRTR